MAVLFCVHQLNRSSTELWNGQVIVYPPGRSAVPVALLALAIGAFGIGTTEFVMMGVLPQAAADFGVSIPSAGYLITGYALGVVVGAPLLTAVAVRLPRKTMLLLTMALFTVGNVLFSLSPSQEFGVLFRF